MDDYILEDKISVECEACHVDMPALISTLENDNTVVCQECGAKRVVNMEELHRQLELMKETLREMHGTGGAIPAESVDKT